MSNYASPPQRVEDVPYRDLDAMHAFAGRWRAEHWGKWFTAPKLSGFCVLMTRAVYDAIGGLDERFGLGLFDDDDLAVRARRARFELAVAHDLFVHHFGSRTFAGNGIDAEALLRENERRFADKWGYAIPRGRRVALSPWAAWSGGTSAERGSLSPDARLMRKSADKDVPLHDARPAEGWHRPPGDRETGSDRTPTGSLSEAEGPPSLWCPSAALRTAPKSALTIPGGRASWRAALRPGSDGASPS